MTRNYKDYLEHGAMSPNVIQLKGYDMEEMQIQLSDFQKKY